MNCPNDQILSAYYDGELPPVELSAVRSHVEACAACHQVVEAMNNASAILQRAELSDVSSEMLRRWASAGTMVQDRSLRRLVGSLTGIAASVLIVASFARQNAADPSVPTIGEWEQIAFAGVDEGDSSHVAARFLAADLSMRSNDPSPRGGERP